MPRVADAPAEDRDEALAGRLGMQGPISKGAPVYDISQEDIRTLSVEWDAQGMRFKPYRTAITEATEQALEDCEFKGGQTALFMAKQMLNHGGDPKSWIQGFAREHGLTQRDRTYHELQTLVQTIWLATTYDALNAGALASLEAVSRQRK